MRRIPPESTPLRPFDHLSRRWQHKKKARRSRVDRDRRFFFSRHFFDRVLLLRHRPMSGYVPRKRIGSPSLPVSRIRIGYLGRLSAAVLTSLPVADLTFGSSPVVVSILFFGHRLNGHIIVRSVHSGQRTVTGGTCEIDPCPKRCPTSVDSKAGARHNGRGPDKKKRNVRLHIGQHWLGRKKRVFT